MSNLEFNKIATSVLVAGIVALAAGNISDILYRPNLNPEKRGFKVEVAAENTGSINQQVKVPEKVDIPALLASANLETGQQIAKKCTMCHTLEEGGHSKVGPNLWNIVGDKKVRDPDYSYSQAIRAKAGEMWSYEDLYHIINKPSNFIPGTKMTFAGISNPQEVADVIIYLRSLSHKPQALPK